MVDITFFYPEAVDDLISISIDLALMYRCDPFVFLDRPASEISELYRLTNKRIKETRED